MDQPNSVDSAESELLPLLLDENFDAGLQRWTTTDREQKEKVWSLKVNHAKRPIASTVGPQAKNFMLRVAGPSPYQPPHRSPHSIALLKEFVVSDFELTAEVQNTNPEGGGHRDLCFFWGFQDPSHFYYVHLGAKPDPHSSQIFIVNDAPRTKITLKQSVGIPWTNGWHRVKVRCATKSGLIEVFFDDMEKPAMTANDKTFAWGRVGIGTFDDNGNFDNVKLRGHRIEPVPPAAVVP